VTSCVHRCHRRPAEPVTRGDALTGSVVAGKAGVCVFEEDLRRPQAILAHPDLRRLLDLRQPVAVVLGGVLCSSSPTPTTQLAW